MNPFLDTAQAFTQMWMDFAGKMTSAAMGLDPTGSPPDTARQFRSAAFGAMAQMTEQFMRSPEVLAMMKQGIDASLQFRKQLNDYMTRMRHETQGTARQDIDAILNAIEHMETRLLDRMESLVDRLDLISRRLDALESGHRGNGDKNLSASPAERRRLRERAESSEE